MSIGTGWRMISLKKSSPRRILLCHSIGSSRRLEIPPELGAVGYRRTHACFAVLVLVDQPDMSIEKPPHLITKPGLLPLFPPLVLFIPSVRMKSESDFPRTETVPGLVES